MLTAAVIIAQAAQPPPSMAGMLVPMVCIFAIMYFLMIRPQQQKEKKLQETRDALKTGDAVITVGGIHGVVSNVKDGSTLTLKIADNVRVDVEKSAIATVLKQDGSPKV